MALKAIANTGMTLQIVQGSPEPVLGTITITGSPSTKVKAGGSFVYQDNLAISISAISTATATIPDPVTATGNMIAEATKVKAEGTLVLRADDLSGTINATPQIPGSPPTNYPVTFKVQVSDAGQTKVSAE